MIEVISFPITIPADANYLSTVVGEPNHQVVRHSIMTRQYPWHRHPNSDETFIGLEGTVIIDTPDGSLELSPGASVTIPKDVLHRTRPKGERSANLTVELADMQTVFEEPQGY